MIPVVLGVLGWILVILGGVVGFAIVLLIIALSIPVTLEIEGSGTPEITIAGVFLFGALRKQLLPSTKEKKDRVPRKKKKRTPHGRAAINLLREERTRSMIIADARRLLGRLVHSFRLQGRGRVSVGLGDPVDTGVLFGVADPLVGWVRSRTGIGIVPNFTGLGVLFDGTGTLSLVPIALIPPAIAFGFSPGGRACIRGIRGKA